MQKLWSHRIITTNLYLVTFHLFRRGMFYFSSFLYPCTFLYFTPLLGFCRRQRSKKTVFIILFWMEQAHVSLRSLMGNYFFSKKDTIWHRARMFMLQAVVLPFPFLGPAIFVDYFVLNNNNGFPPLDFGSGITHLLHPRMIVCSDLGFLSGIYSCAVLHRGSVSVLRLLVTGCEIADLHLSRQSHAP